MRLNAEGLHYKELNSLIRQAVAGGETEIILDNVCGHRYIGDGMRDEVSIEINGIPGNDLCAFMDGVNVVVNGNVQDGVANTMNSGSLVVYGCGGDILGYSMRGGSVFIRDSVGYRAGIHMKEYGVRKPVLVIGGRAGDYLGEYMAGGVLIVLGIESWQGEKLEFCKSPVGAHVGTGMHGGVMYIYGPVEDWQLGAGVGMTGLSEDDWIVLRPEVERYCGLFGCNPSEFNPAGFSRLKATTTRPYGRLYAY